MIASSDSTNFVSLKLIVFIQYYQQETNKQVLCIVKQKGDLISCCKAGQEIELQSLQFVRLCT